MLTVCAGASGVPEMATGASPPLPLASLELSPRRRCGRLHPSTASDLAWASQRRTATST